jgi:hypothetical protein
MTYSFSKLLDLARLDLEASLVLGSVLALRHGQTLIGAGLDLAASKGHTVTAAS